MDIIELRFRLSLTAIIVAIIVGTIGFMMIESLSLIDAIYFSIMSITTVGYGDIAPVTTLGKSLAVIVVLFGVGGFLGLVASGFDLLLIRRNNRVRTHKLYMAIGAFFSEVGNDVISIFINADPQIKKAKNDLIITDSWSEKDFFDSSKHMKTHNFKVKIEKIDLHKIRSLLMGKRNFLIELLQFPELFEQDTFTELLRAIFHLTEELTFRTDLKRLPKNDLNHLKTDIERTYSPLVHQWLDHMEYLKNNYPYLFSLSIRTNPFDPTASPILK